MAAGRTLDAGISLHAADVFVDQSGGDHHLDQRSGDHHAGYRGMCANLAHWRGANRRLRNPERLPLKKGPQNTTFPCTAIEDAHGFCDAVQR
jgi:hypothetical protein